MLRDLGMCVIIVGLSGAMAVATNVMRERPLDWMRRETRGANPVPVNPSGVPHDREAVDSADAGETDTAPVATHAADDGVVMADVLAALTNGSAYFVDAREKNEYEEGHLRGAVNMPSSAIYANEGAVTAIIPPDARVIVYCGGGQCEASHNVADALRRDFGYMDVVIYTKGWEEVVTSEQLAEFIAKGDQ